MTDHKVMRGDAAPITGARCAGRRSLLRRVASAAAAGLQRKRGMAASALASLLPLVAAATLGMSGSAVAQERTTATYDDWILQCVIQHGQPAQKTCDIDQVTEVRGRNVPLSRISITIPKKGRPARLTAQVPVNVLLATPVIIKTADSDPGISAPFDRCLPAGCFADFAIQDETIKKFRAAKAVGKLTFKSANGQVVTIPVSFKGFGTAFDALAGL